MDNVKKKYWMVRTHTCPGEFAGKGLVGLGWSGINICPGISTASEEEIFDQLAELYNCDSISGKSKGEIRRFRSIGKGDVIVVPCYKGYYLGVSTGEYFYDESNEDDHKNQMKVIFTTDDSGNLRFYSRGGKKTALQSKLGTRFTILEIREQEIINELENQLNGGTSLRDEIIKRENETLEDFRKNLPAI